MSMNAKSRISARRPHQGKLPKARCRIHKRPLTIVQRPSFERIFHYKYCVVVYSENYSRCTNGGGTNGPCIVCAIEPDLRRCLSLPPPSKAAKTPPTGVDYQKNDYASILNSSKPVATAKGQPLVGNSNHQRKPRSSPFRLALRMSSPRTLDGAPTHRQYSVMT